LSACAKQAFISGNAMQSIRPPQHLNLNLKHVDTYMHGDVVDLAQQLGRQIRVVGDARVGYLPGGRRDLPDQEKVQQSM
jgi:hypothetical protein